MIYSTSSTNLTADVILTNLICSVRIFIYPFILCSAIFVQAQVNDPFNLCEGYQTNENYTERIPNPSFEENACCPSPYSFSCVSSWVQPTAATTDYFNTCGFVQPALNQAGLVPFPDGDGIIGLGTVIGFQEYFGVCLNAPLEPGEDLSLTMQIAYTPINGGVYCANQAPHSSIEITIYGHTSCNNLFVPNTTGCLTDADPSWQIIGTVVYNPSAAWTELVIDLDIPQSINAIIIGGPCELPSDYAIGAGNGGCNPYFYFDNIALENTILDVELDVLSSGNPCQNNLEINASINTTGGVWQWFHEGILLPGETSETIEISANGYPDGIYSVRYIIGDFCIVTEIEIDLSNNDAPIPNCPPDLILCINQALTELEGGSPADGIFSGPGVSGNFFNAGSAGIGIHTISYTVTSMNGCTASCNFTIEVTPLPDVICPADFEVCGLENSYTLEGAIPANGQFSGPGVNIDVFVAADAGLGEHEITYLYEDLVCDLLCTFFISVNPLPQIECPNDIDICESADGFTIPDASQTGGIYSGLGVDGDVFQPALSGPGIHEITYAFEDANKCSGFCTFNIHVVPLQGIVCPDDLQICSSSLPFLLDTALPSGGIYSGTGVDNNMFNPSNSGTGIFTIEYSIPNSACQELCTFIITVDEKQDANCPEMDDVCLQSPSFTVPSAFPAGGTFSGPGINNGIFNPLIAGIGSHSIAYEYTDASGCVYNCASEINVLDRIEAVCPGRIETCLNNLPFPIMESSPAGGTYTGPGLDLGIFSPSLAGVGLHTLSYELQDGNGCIFYCSMEVQVNDVADLNLPDDFSVCASDSPFLLNDAFPEGGIYQGPGVNNNIFTPDPGLAGSNIISYTFTDNNNCTVSENFIINIVPKPEVSGDTTLHCFASDTAFLSAQGTGIWSLSSLNTGSATINNPASSFTFISGFSQLGTYILIWETEGVCTDTIVINTREECDCIILNNNIRSNIISYCDSADPYLEGSIPEPPGGNFQWWISEDGINFQLPSGPSNLQNFNPGVLNPGIYFFRRSYQVLTPEICQSNSNIIRIEVNETPEAGAQIEFPEICQGNTQIFQLELLLENEEDNGSWEDISLNPSPAGSFDHLAGTFNTTDVSYGEYLFRYIMTGTGICGADTSTVSILIHPLPSAGIIVDPGEVINCRNTAVTLKASDENPDLAYSWNLENVEISTNSQHSVTESGEYTLIVRDVNTACFAQNSVIISDETDYPFISIETPLPLTCSRSEILLDASNSQSSSRIVHAWLDSNGALIQSGNGLLISVSNPGVYFLQSRDTINGCINQVQVEVREDRTPPSVDAGMDQSLICGRDNAVLNGSILNSSGNLSVMWATSSGVIISGMNTLTAEVKGEGWYILTAIDLQNDCTASDSVLVTIGNVSFEITNIDGLDICHEQSLASININSEGLQPLQYFINGIYAGTSGLIPDLLPGQYNLRIVDNQGCVSDTVFTIIKRNEISINLPSQVQIREGDTMSLQAIISIPDHQISSVKWIPGDQLSCDTCLLTNAWPGQSSTYILEITDELGCSGQSAVEILVSRKIKVFIPDAFSPNADGINDNFTIYSPEIQIVRSLKIYDRWGNVVFDKSNFQANNPMEGWNGSFKSQTMSPSAFAYVSEVVLSNGEVLTLSGEVQLVR